MALPKWLNLPCSMRAAISVIHEEAQNGYMPDGLVIVEESGFWQVRRRRMNGDGTVTIEILSELDTEQEAEAFLRQRLEADAVAATIANHRKERGR